MLSSGTILNIVEILKKQHPPEFANLESRHLEQVQERAFRPYYQARSLFLKWIFNNIDFLLFSYPC